MLFRETIRIVLKPFNAFVVQDFEIVTKRVLTQAQAMDLAAVLLRTVKNLMD